MNIAELNGSHVGRKITLHSRGASVTAILAGVSHGADSVSDIRFDGVTTVSLGRRRTILRFLHAGEVRAGEGATFELHPDGD